MSHNAQASTGQDRAKAESAKKPMPEVPHVLSRWVKDANGMSRCEVLTKRRALGKGGFAVVYEMQRSEDGRPFACKASPIFGAICCLFYNRSN